MMDSLPGRKLDQFFLETMLGKGGMARVYRAWDTQRSVYVAIKVIDKAFRNDSEYTRRFDLEAKAIQRLTHPNIVRLFQYGDADGVLYMAMAYIEGSDLEALLAKYQSAGETIPDEDAIRIVRQISAALDYSHAEGIIHRDIKTANIMINEHGDAILTDFGLALLTDVGTYGEIFGSPHYLSPEQALSSADAIPLSDFYSLGVVLYEMYTGQVPFDAERPIDIAMKHVTDEPVPPSQLNPEISPALEAVILNAMAKEPENRYSNGVALANAFEEAMQSRISTQPSSRQSIAERVAIEVSNNPLPPPPAAVQKPPLAQTQLSKPPNIVSAPPPSTQTNQIPTVPRQAPQTNHRNWILYAGIAATLLLIICLAGLALTFIFDGDDGNNEAPIPTNSAQVAIDATSTEASTDTPPPIPATEVVPATPTPFDLPTSTLTLIPMTSTPVEIIPTATATVEIQSSLTYTIVIYRRGQDSIFVVNETAGEFSFPLTRLRLDSGRDAIEGEDWDREFLNYNECVTAWKDSGNPRAPDVECNEVGEKIERKGPERFWKRDFDVYFDDESIGTCDEDRCTFEIGD